MTNDARARKAVREWITSTPGQIQAYDVLVDFIVAALDAKDTKVKRLVLACEHLMKFEYYSELGPADFTECLNKARIALKGYRSERL